MHASMTLLHPGFRPGENDVICAKGKRSYNHIGNQSFRALAKMHAKDFDKATSKSSKGKVVTLIVNTIHSHGGDFVKEVNGNWYRVTERMAREKVGSEFRNILHTKYSSSTKAKARARNNQQEQRRCQQRRSASTKKNKRKSPSTTATPSSIVVSPESSLPFPMHITSGGTSSSSTYQNHSNKALDEENKMMMDSMPELTNDAFSSFDDDEPLPFDIRASDTTNINIMDNNPILLSDLDECNDWFQEEFINTKKETPTGQNLGITINNYCSV